MPTRPAISVTASASVGETIAPSVNATAHARPSQLVRDGGDAGHRRADEADGEQRDRPQVRAQVAQRGEERRRVEKRRQQRDEDDVRRQHELRQPGHEAERDAAGDEQHGYRQPQHGREREQRAERDEQRREAGVPRAPRSSPDYGRLG